MLASLLLALAIDLTTHEGAALAAATWRYSDVRIVEVPTTDAAGHAVVTNDFEPHAGAADFNDATWEVIDPTTLGNPRGNGRVSFNWYRVRVTIPEKVDGKPVAGMAVYFQTVVDDYGEVWVDGSLPRDADQNGGAVVAGFNAANRCARRSSNSRIRRTSAPCVIRSLACPCLGGAPAPPPVRAGEGAGAPLILSSNIGTGVGI